MSTTDRRGVLISFEGGDGSGKTTQLRLLAGRLRSLGRDVLETAEPGGAAIGQQIRDILLDPRNRAMAAATELLLYFAARAQNVEQCIRPALERGMVVLADRFTDSTLAYQGAGRQLGSDVVLALHQVACGDLNPALTLYIDLDTEVALSRVESRSRPDRLDSEAEAFHRRVRAEYLRLASEAPGRIRLIDGSGTPQEVAGHVWQAVQAYV